MVLTMIAVIVIVTLMSTVMMMVRGWEREGPSTKTTNRRIKSTQSDTDADLATDPDSATHPGTTTDTDAATDTNSDTASDNTDRHRSAQI